MAGRFGTGLVQGLLLCGATLAAVSLAAPQPDRPAGTGAGADVPAQRDTATVATSPQAENAKAPASETNPEAPDAGTAASPVAGTPAPRDADPGATGRQPEGGGAPIRAADTVAPDAAAENPAPSDVVVPRQPEALATAGTVTPDVPNATPSTTDGNTTQAAVATAGPAAGEMQPDPGRSPASTPPQPSSPAPATGTPTTDPAPSRTATAPAQPQAPAGFAAPEDRAPVAPDALAGDRPRPGPGPQAPRPWAERPPETEAPGAVSVAVPPQDADAAPQQVAGPAATDLPGALPQGDDAPATVSAASPQRVAAASPDARPATVDPPGASSVTATPSAPARAADPYAPPRATPGAPQRTLRPWAPLLPQPQQPGDAEALSAPAPGTAAPTAPLDAPGPRVAAAQADAEVRSLTRPEDDEGVADTTDAALPRPNATPARATGVAADTAPDQPGPATPVQSDALPVLARAGAAASRTAGTPDLPQRPAPAEAAVPITGLVPPTPPGGYPAPDLALPQLPGGTGATPS